MKVNEAFLSELANNAEKLTAFLKFMDADQQRRIEVAMAIIRAGVPLSVPQLARAAGVNDRAVWASIKALRLRAHKSSTSNKRGPRPMMVDAIEAANFVISRRIGVGEVNYA